MKYNIYYDKKGKLEKITIYANSLEQLKHHGDMPSNIISIDEQNTDILSIFKKKEDIIDTIYQMKIMLESKLNFEDILDILIQNNKSGNKYILKTIKDALKSGDNIDKALVQYKKHIGIYMIVFFKIARINSNISQCITALYEILFEDKRLKQDLIKVFTYPMILVVSLIIAVGSIFSFVLPKFTYIYAKFGENLPYSTQLLLDIKYVVDNYLSLIIIVILMLLFFMRFIYKKYQHYFDKLMLLDIPIFSTMYRDIHLYKLFLSLHMLVKTQNKFQDALFDIQDMITNKYLYSSVDDILQKMNDGDSLSQAFLKVELFDQSTIKLLKISEESNNLELVLQDIKKIYKAKIIKSMDKFKTFLEPLLIIVISSVVLYLVLAIMTPIWDLNSIIK